MTRSGVNIVFASTKELERIVVNILLEILTSSIRLIGEILILEACIVSSVENTSSFRVDFDHLSTKIFFQILFF